jgi:hypothetical protein
MAELISKASGNFTDSTTWAGIDTSTGATQLVRNTNTTQTASYSYSPTFTITNGVIIEGVVLYLQLGGSADARTFSVSLSDDNGVTATREVEVNCSDIATVVSQPTWVFFKFNSSLTGDGGGDYRLGVKVSATAGQNIGVFRSSSATADWTRMIVIQGDVTPASTDNLYVVGELTGQGTGNDFEVTMNNTSSTTFGLLNVGKRGTLSWGAASSTNYLLKLAGNLEVFSGGTYNQGTSGTPIPASSTSILEFVCTSNVQFGFEIRTGSTVNIYGAEKIVKCKLDANAAAGATTMTTDISTGWKSGDEIAIPSTTRTAAQAEMRALTSDASGTTLSVAALTNAHDGVDPYVADLANLTRNVKIRGTSTTLQSYINIENNTNVNIYYTEIYWMGSATENKRGINVALTNGVLNFYGCSFHSFTVANSITFFCSTTSGDVINVSYCVMYNNNIGFAVSGNGIRTLDNCLLIRVSGFITHAFMAHDRLTNITITSNGGTGLTLNHQFSHIESTSLWENVNIYSNNGFGFNMSPINSLTVNSGKIWRNNGNGFTFTGVNVGNPSMSKIIISNIVFFGNQTSGMILGGTTNCQGLFLIDNCDFLAGDTLVQPSALTVNSNLKTYVTNCSFNCSVQDLNTANIKLESTLVFFNCEFLSPALFPSQGPTQIPAFGKIISYNHNKVEGSIIGWGRVTQFEKDVTIYRTASPSLKITPRNSTGTTTTTLRTKVSVNSGSTATVNVWVRRSAAGDGAAHNGSVLPRLMLGFNPVMGINADTEIATATTASNGAWELISGTTPAAPRDGVYEFWVETNGTTGWVNVDDWSTSINNDKTGYKYWDLDGPIESIEHGMGGGETSYVFC